MGWNQKHYENVKKDCVINISTGNKSAYCYMKEYETMIDKEDYEAAKAITEVLLPLGYNTLETHSHIKSLHEKNVGKQDRKINN